MATDPKGARRNGAEASTADQAVWPVFICYRQDDGKDIAQWLYDNLHTEKLSIPGSDQDVACDVYFDQTAAAVDDWTRIHQPALERARALLFVCTPGARSSFGPDDWVHRELRWWLEHRDASPIIIDPHDSDRWIPDLVKERWPNQQRVLVQPREWGRLPSEERETLEKNARERLIRGLIESERETTYEDLRRERERSHLLQKQSRRLKVLLGATLLLMMATTYLLWQRAIDAEDVLTTRDAEAIIAAMTTKQVPQLSSVEFDALWRLALTTNESVRDKLLRFALNSRGNAHSFHLRGDLLLNAAIGLNEKRQQRVVREILSPSLKSFSSQPEIALASAHMGRLLLVAPAQEANAVEWLQLLLGALVSTIDGPAAGELTRAIDSMLDRIHALKATQLLADALAHLQPTLPETRVKEAIDLLEKTTKRLTSEGSSSGFRVVVEAWSKAPDDHKPHYRGVISLLSRHTPSDIRREAAVKLLGITLGDADSVSLILDQTVLEQADLRGDERKAAFEVLLKAIESHEGQLPRQVRTAIALASTDPAGPSPSSIDALTSALDTRLRGVDIDSKVAVIGSLAAEFGGSEGVTARWAYELLVNQLEKCKSYYLATARLANVLVNMPGSMPESVARQSVDAMLHVIHRARTGEKGDIPQAGHLRNLGKGLEKAIGALPGRELHPVTKRMLSQMQNPPRDYRHNDAQLAAFARGLVALTRRGSADVARFVLETSNPARGFAQRGTVSIVKNLVAIADGDGDTASLVKDTVNKFDSLRSENDLLSLFMEILRDGGAEPPHELVTEIVTDLLLRRGNSDSRWLLEAAMIAAPSISRATATKIYQEATADPYAVDLRSLTTTVDVMSEVVDRLSIRQVNAFASDLAKKTVKAEDATVNAFIFKHWLEAIPLLVQPLVQRISADGAYEAASQLLHRRSRRLGKTSAEILKLLSPRLNAEARARMALGLLSVKSDPAHRNLRTASDLVAGLPQTSASTQLSTRLIGWLDQLPTETDYSKKALSIIAGMARDLTPSLNAQDRKRLSGSFAARVVSLEDHALLHSFSETLGALSTALNTDVHRAIVAHITDRLGDPATAPDDLPFLTKALASLPGEIAPSNLQVAFDSLQARMLELRDLTAQDPLGEAVQSLPGRLEPAQLLEVLKWPTTTGVLRQEIVKRIERQEGVGFRHSLKELVAWSGSKNVEVHAAPRRRPAPD